MNAQPELPLATDVDPRLTVITTETSQEFFALCARAEAEELRIESVAVGPTPAQWIFTVRYSEGGVFR